MYLYMWDYVLLFYIFNIDLDIMFITDLSIWYSLNSMFCYRYRVKQHFLP